MIICLVTYLTVAYLTNQLCDKGCLKCNSKNECLFCDASNNFYLANSTCALSKSPNCLMLDLNGDCAQCASGYFLDSSTRRCVAVSISKTISNCLYYGPDQSCVRCAKRFVANGGQCQLVKKLVDDCDVYSEDGKCFGCTAGSTLNSMSSICMPNQSLNSCSSFTFLNCKACAPGYILNKNFYFSKYQTNKTLLFSDIRNFVTGTGNNNGNSMSVCQKIIDKNCLKSTAFDKCKECKAGYFLNKNYFCIPNPFPQISECKIYSSSETCQVCNEGFYVETPFKCSPITGDKLIANCTSYDTTASTVRCAQCIGAKYLSGNACTSDRINSLNIINCKTVDPKADSCLTCNQNFLLTNDANKCLAAINNCDLYSNIDSSTTVLSCKKCSDTYYLDTSNSGTSCVAGTIEGCLVYGSKTTCLACNTQAYYLDNSKCTKHVKVENCLVYSGINFNKCTTCAAGFYPFNLINTCSLIAVIANCVQYSDANTCSACASRYFLQNNACLSISATFPNCEYAANGATNCGRCSKGYALKNLDNDKTCVPLHNYILDQCDSPATNVVLKANNLVDYNSCLVCKENSIVFDLNGLFACVSNSLLNTRGISLPVTDCKQYSNDASPVCLQCSGFLSIPSSGPRVCSTSCNPASNTNVKDNLDGNINTCASNSADGPFSLSGCSSAIKVYENSLTLKCMKFASNKAYVPLTAAPSNNPSYWRDIDDSSVPRADGAFLYFGYPVFNSINTDIDSHQNEGDSNKSCELYWKTGSVLYCYRCKWGYASKHYIPSGESALKTRCVVINGCDTSVSYTGFSAQLNQVLSCHACTSNQFVTVIVGTAADNTDFNVSSLVQNKQTIQCLPVETNPNLDTSESKPKFVDGCLIYGWIYTTTNPAAPVGPTFARGCLACKSGYKLSGNFGTCSPIANCDSNQKLMANRCSLCAQTSASGSVELRAFRNYLAQECVLVSTDNCLFADSTADASNKYTCTICKPGYWLNYDKICEKLTLPQCFDASGSTNINLSSFFISNLNTGVYYILKYLSKANTVTGCDTCGTGFSAIQMNLGERQCIKSSYIQSNSLNLSSTKYIPGCNKYNNLLYLSQTPIMTCNSCIAGKILTTDGKKCVDMLPNCLVSSSTDVTKCDTCIDTHTPLSGICVTKNIPNCLNYDNSANNSEMLCVDCVDGFVLSANKKTCYKGSVSACKKYDLDMPWSCNTCMDGYSKINTPNSKSYCFKTSSQSNCQALSLNNNNGLKGGYYNCEQCTTNNTVAYIPKPYVNLDQSLPQSICLSLNLIEKCIDYDVSIQGFSYSSFVCNACETGFYLEKKNNTCVSRTVQPSGCTAYYVDIDKCQSCNSTTFKSPDETDCVGFPNGILRCSSYSNETTCSSCYAPAFLSNNSCIVSNIIDKCVSYSANNTCSKCERGYFLASSTSCVPAIASNCYTYSSSTSCDECDPSDNNKGLKTNENGITNCVDINIPNCDLSTTKYPFVCLQCKSGFYLDGDKNCKFVINIINKCIIYDSESTCVQCLQGYALSSDRKSCNDTYFNTLSDSNCADTQITETPSCSICKPGYIFVNQTCTLCRNNTYNMGCYSCDPINQTNCLACRPGFYQTPSGNCLAFFTLLNSTDGVPDDTCSSTILKILEVLCLLFILIY